MTIGKGWMFVFGVIAGALIGAAMPNQINALKSELRSFTSTLANTAGRGSQDVGGFVAE